jgi:4-amino-4-deoxy-L-arabinose transferase-like glycosyltransferase
LRHDFFTAARVVHSSEHQHQVGPAEARLAPTSGLRRSLSRRNREILPLAGAFAVALVVLSQGINAPFAGVQEPLQAQLIQDIISHGHWLVARDYYRLINLKPPLYFWLSALLVGCAGGHVTEPLSRIVSLIAGAALATEVLIWTKAALGRLAGWFAYGVLLGSYGFASFATVNITDMLMSLLLFTGYCITYPLTAHTRSGNRALFAGVFLGLATLTKGPVALILCGLAIVLFLVLRGENPLVLVRWLWPWQLLLAAFLIAAPWYVAAAAQYGREFTNVVIAENLGHALAAASTTGTGPAQAWTFIPLRLLRAMLPFVFMLMPLTLAALLGCIDPAARKPVTFHLAMVTAVVLFFSLVHSVQAYYVLPALPSLAIVLSAVFAVGSELGGAKQTIAVRCRDASLAAISTTMLMLVLFSWWYCSTGRSVDALKLRPSSDDWRLAYLYYQQVVHLQLQFLMLAIIIGVGAIVSTAGVISRRHICTAAGTVVAVIAAVAFWTGSMRTKLYDTLTTKSFVSAVRQRVGDARIYTVTQNYEITFYYGRALPIYRHLPVKDMYGRDDLPCELLRPADDRASSAYVILRHNEQVYLRPEELDRLRPVLAAKHGVFRSPGLYRIDAEQTSFQTVR